MKDIQKELLLWSKQFEVYHLPRWDELPEMDLYMDQVIEYISHYVEIFADDSEHKMITPAMINNYVKLGLIPSPVKKRYSKIHISTLLVITIIKQVTVISLIRNAIDIQMGFDGGRGAYNCFCEELELSIKQIYDIISNNCISINEKTTPKNLAVKSISMALTGKIIATKVTGLTENGRIGEKDEKDSDNC